MIPLIHLPISHMCSKGFQLFSHIYILYNKNILDFYMLSRKKISNWRKPYLLCWFYGQRMRIYPRHLITCVHLPDIHRAIRTSNHKVVICRTPFDDVDREEVSRRQHDALPFPEAEQANRMVTGHGADTVLHSCLQSKHNRKWVWSSWRCTTESKEVHLNFSRLPLLLSDGNNINQQIKAAAAEGNHK